jgi:hypothetical protein
MGGKKIGCSEVSRLYVDCYNVGKGYWVVWFIGRKFNNLTNHHG